MSQIQEEPQTQSTYIYLLQEKRFVKTGQNIYRITNIPVKQSTILLQFDCFENFTKIYNCAASFFSKEFTKCENIGENYFEGDCKEMTNVLLYIFYEVNDAKSNVEYKVDTNVTMVDYLNKNRKNVMDIDKFMEIHVKNITFADIMGCNGDNDETFNIMCLFIQQLNKLDEMARPVYVHNLNPFEIYFRAPDKFGWYFDNCRYQTLFEYFTKFLVILCEKMPNFIKEFYSSPEIDCYLKGKLFRKVYAIKDLSTQLDKGCTKSNMRRFRQLFNERISSQY